MQLDAPSMTSLACPINSLEPAPICAHCGLQIKDPGLSGFCCLGCKLVYQIIQDRGLTEYYQMRKSGASIRPAVPATVSDSNHAYLENPEFLALYSDAGRMEFYLEGVHCAACIWLLEKVPQYVDGVESVTVDLGRSTATVRIGPSGSFAAVAREFERLGYRPHPIRDGEAESLRKRENRTFLIRLGVAGGCAGNIMLFAFSLYGGATGPFATHFRWLSLIVFLPVLLFSAVPFYRNAWAALRTRTVSIDVPIVLGILLGFLASVFNLLTGSEHIYFDSLAALVFLLLASRYVLLRAQQSALNSTGLAHFLTPSTVRRKAPGTTDFVESTIDLLKPGDRVEVRVGEPVPVDGIIIEGSTVLNCALLTGESTPVPANPGMRVFAGTVNEQAPVEVEVQAFGAQTRLGRILKSVEESITRKAPIVALADRVSRAFVAAVLVLAAGAFLWGARSGDWASGINYALAMVIVTCPCALALATPLAMIVSIRRAAQAGILIKGADVLEKLADTDQVFLDKTGTLTEGEFEVARWAPEPGLEREAAAAVLALEAQSNHPIARALIHHLRSDGPSPARVEGFQERIGRGVTGTIGGHSYEIRQLPESESRGSAGSHVGVYRDGRVIARITLGERLRGETKSAVEELRRLGVKPRILTGDTRSAALKVAAQLGIPESDVLSEATPETKRQVVAFDRSPGMGRATTMMVGDGANDAVALAAADVGVAVHGGMEVSLRAADAYLQQKGLKPICTLIQLGRETRRVLIRNFAFSLAYNVAGVLAVLTGWVGPLFAAVLMPVSALTVFASSLAGTRGMRRALGPGRKT